MLRALGVPSVLGAAGLSHTARPGDMVVVDGSAGSVTLNPSPETVIVARRAVAAFARERQRYARLRRLPAEMTDGEKVELQANFELPVELPLIAQSGAQGIGLLRTEFLFMNRELDAGRKRADGNLSRDRRGHEWRSGNDPRAGLGR